jgi:diacylglycerol kinase (ATP)
VGDSKRDPAIAGRQYPFARVAYTYRRGFLSGFRYAGEGLQYAFSSQRNFRFHLSAALAAITLAIWLAVPLQSWALLALTIGSVLVMELLNTAAETLVDLVSPDYNPLAKRVKDLMAAAVLVAALVSIVVGISVLGPPLWARLGFG